MPSIPKPPREELDRLYNQDGLSAYAIAKVYSVSDPTVKTWLLYYGLWDENKAKHNMKNPKTTEAMMAQIAPVGEGEVVEAEIEEAGGQFSTSQDQEDESPFGRLSRAQKECVVLLADLSDRMTEKQIADKLNINQNTITAWKKNPDFHYCLMAMRKVEMERELTMKWSEDMVERYKKGDKSLTSADRELAAKVLGLFTDGPTTNVQVNFKEEGGLDGRFRR